MQAWAAVAADGASGSRDGHLGVWGVFMRVLLRMGDGESSATQGRCAASPPAPWCVWGATHRIQQPCPRPGLRLLLLLVLLPLVLLLSAARGWCGWAAPHGA